MSLCGAPAAPRAVGRGGARERAQFSPQAETELSGLCDDDNGGCICPAISMAAYTVAALRFPSPGGAANRAASSKPPRFIRRWRRFGDFPRPMGRTPPSPPAGAGIKTASAGWSPPSPQRPPGPSAARCGSWTACCSTWRTPRWRRTPSPSAFPPCRWPPPLPGRGLW